jgi:hypothetical protein
MSCDHRECMYPPGIVWCRLCGAIRPEQDPTWILPKAETDARKREQLMHSGGAPALTSRMGPMHPAGLRGFDNPDEYSKQRAIQRRLAEEISRMSILPKPVPADVPDKREALDAVKLADKVFR